MPIELIRCLLFLLLRRRISKRSIIRGFIVIRLWRGLARNFCICQKSLVYASLYRYQKCAHCSVNSTVSSFVALLMHKLQGNCLKFKNATRLTLQKSCTIPRTKRREKYQRFIINRIENNQNEKSRPGIIDKHPNTKKTSAKITTKLRVRLIPIKQTYIPNKNIKETFINKSAVNRISMGSL